MTILSDYGAHFREAFTALHGGRPDDDDEDDGAEQSVERRPDEPLDEFLTRSRGQALGRLQRQLASAEPPLPLRKAHDILVRLLDSSAEADAALAAQVEAYRCDQLQESIAHSDRLQALVTESARLDRELILALREAESDQDGTLTELGLSDIVSPA